MLIILEIKRIAIYTRKTNYMVEGDQEDHCSRPALAKKLAGHHLNQ
jgi:hypothetical protein